MESCERPLFLVGALRSGTTLLGLMLDHHPSIAFPGEFELAIDFMGPDGQEPDLHAYHAWLRVHRHFIAHELAIDPKLAYRELVASLLAQMRRTSRGPERSHLGVAVHRRFRCLLKLWPQARFVHLVRDPRDVAASLIVQGWAGNTYTGARLWKETEEEWERASAEIPAERRIDVQFEELATEPVATLERICAFIGVPYREEMLRYPEDSTYAAVDPTLAGRWRRTLSARGIRLAEAAAGNLLVERGYAPSGLARLELPRIGAPLVSLHCRLVRLRFRIQRYGLWLWVRRRTASALGLEAWRRRILLEEHEITNRHLQ
jgi:hypothetical protein